MAGDLTYSIDGCVVDPTVRARVVARVRRYVPDVEGQAEVLAMLGLADTERHGQVQIGPKTPGGRDAGRDASRKGNAE